MSMWGYFERLKFYLHINTVQKTEVVSMRTRADTTNSCGFASISLFAQQLTFEWLPSFLISH